MKKLLKKRKNNKGFSLVELIVVVAIMAVLIGVLVPTLVRNVEKSKKQKDISTVEEVRNQLTIGLADEKYSALSGTITCNNGIVALDGSTRGVNPEDTAADYIKEVCQNLNAKDTFKKQLTSKAYGTATVTFTIGDEKVTATIAGEKESATLGE